MKKRLFRSAYGAGKQSEFLKKNSFAAKYGKKKKNSKTEKKLIEQWNELIRLIMH